jgi:hypothetical protein
MRHRAARLRPDPELSKLPKKTATAAQQALAETLRTTSAGRTPSSQKQKTIVTPKRQMVFH